MSWRPILEGEDRVRAEAVIADLALAYRDAQPEPGQEGDWITLARGEPGIPLFYAYLAAATGEDEWADRACERLESAADRAPSAARDPYLFTGLLGIAWAIEHVSRLLGLSAGGETGDLLELLDQPDESTPFELYRGLAGAGVFALERLPDPDAARFLERLVDKLAAIAERHGDQVTWLSSPARLPARERDRFPVGYHSLGVAHGVPGPLAVLAGAARHGVAADRARALCDGAVAWLARQRLPEGEPAAYPAVAGGRATRPGWCYGDPGLALVLAETGRALGRADLAAEAIGMARLAAARKPETAGLVDAPLCHGTAGLAHILNRFYQACGEEELRLAAVTWFRATLDAWRPARGARGFATVEQRPGRDETREGAHVGLLDGSAGVGLALLAATSEVAPGWDRVFAMSLRG